MAAANKKIRRTDGLHGADIGSFGQVVQAWR